jgi:hypothetical protein
VIEQYLADLKQCLAEVRDKRTDDRSTSYATLEYYLAGRSLREDQAALAAAA